MSGIIVLVLATAVVAGRAQTLRSAGQTAPALFTDAQAKEGEAVYAKACAACHGATLSGGSAPALAGPAFARSWTDPRTTLDDIFFIIRTTMPPNAASTV